MRHHALLTGLGMVALSSAVAIGAQQPPPMPKPTTTAMTADTVTASGCLEAGKADGDFMLTKSALRSGMESGTPAKPNALYRLKADPGVNLKPHVGHQIEVTGKKEAAAKPMTPSMTPPTPSPTSPAPPAGTIMSADTTPVLRVTAVKMIAATCNTTS